MTPRLGSTLSLALALTLGGCGDDDPAGTGGAGATLGTHVRMDFTLPSPFAAPWPSEARRRADGGVDVADFPNPTDALIVRQLLAVLASDARGFSGTAGVFFTLDGPLASDVVVPLSGSLSADATVFVVPIVTGVAGPPHPIEARYRADGGPFGAEHLLSVVPLQGRPLAPSTLHAVVVRTSLSDAAGRPLLPSPEVAELARGGTPEGLGEAARVRYAEALAALASAGVAPGDIAGLTVFETDDPTVTLVRAYADARTRPLPAPAAPLELTDVFPGYCVYASTIEMPGYQHGTSPYTSEGGGFVPGPDGTPTFAKDEPARIVVTLPRSAMPAAGFPVVLFSRTGAGGDRPLVDRGVRGEPGGPVLEPGSGLARDFAAAGFAGVTIDGPHGGPRNPSGSDEQFLMFNVGNPLALRDNVRQSALELALAAHVIAALTVPRGDCPDLDVAEARLDGGRLALFGHSMGATIAPLALHLEPQLGAIILSGAGGSYIENIVHKQKPLAVRGLAEVILGVAGRWELHEHDPVLSLLQWAAEPADPPVYAAAISHAPGRGGAGASDARHVLMLQGIVDNYILPPIANALSLSLGLDLAGPALDAGHPELTSFTPLATRLPYVGGAAISLPISGNRDDGRATAVVVQHAEDRLEDGHEAVFQTEPPKAQIRCFLRSFAETGVPVVVGSEGCE